MEGGGSMTARRAVQQILLCGFMGCGKTSVGQALAFRLRWDFLDTDALIEKRTGMSIPEIFAEQGGTELPQDGAAGGGDAGEAPAHRRLHRGRIFDAGADGAGAAAERRL